MRCGVLPGSRSPYLYEKCYWKAKSTWRLKLTLHWEWSSQKNIKSLRNQTLDVPYNTPIQSVCTQWMQQKMFHEICFETNWSNDEEWRVWSQQSQLVQYNCKFDADWHHPRLTWRGSHHRYDCVASCRKRCTNINFVPHTVKDRLER